MVVNNAIQIAYAWHIEIKTISYLEDRKTVSVEDTVSIKLVVQENKIKVPAITIML